MALQENFFFRIPAKDISLRTENLPKYKDPISKAFNKYKRLIVVKGETAMIEVVESLATVFEYINQKDPLGITVPEAALRYLRIMHEKPYNMLSSKLKSETLEKVDLEFALRKLGDDPFWFNPLVSKIHDLKWKPK